MARQRHGRAVRWPAARVVAVLAALVLVGGAEKPAAAATNAFVWPVSGWVTSTTEYRNGTRHYGSADIAAPFFTPVGAARGGTVRYAGWQSYSGSRNYVVEISHGSGYVTRYTHFVEQPVVTVGQVVRTNDVLGYVGRTGSATNGPHVHFGLKRNGTDLPIPGLRWGTWVRRAAFVPGDWAGIGSTVPVRSPYAVRAAEALPVFSASQQSATVLGTVAAGTTLTVHDSASGYLKVAFGGGFGYVVSSGVEQTRGAPYGVETTSSADVWGDAVGGSRLGGLPMGELATVFEAAGGRLRILFGFPTVYGWVDAASVARTPRFRTHITEASVRVRTAPSIDAPVVGTLTIGECSGCGGKGNNVVNNYQTVYGVTRGWYEIVYGGQRRYIAGWATPGRH